MNETDNKAQEPEKDPAHPLTFIFRGVPLVIITVILVTLMINRDELLPPKTSSDLIEVDSIGFGKSKPVITKKPETPKKPQKPKTTKTSDTQKPQTQTTTSNAQTTKPEANAQSTSNSTTSTKPATRPKVDWSKTKITGPIDGSYIAIFLSRRIVALIKDNQYVRVYYYAKTPQDIKSPKNARNDRKAPIGDYYISKHELQGKVMTLVLSYPSPSDAAKALAAGRISTQQKTAIEQAYNNRNTPPVTTALGGPVRIRGAGSANTADKTSTGSNISIAPAQMEELWLATKKGTPVRIVP